MTLAPVVHARGVEGRKYERNVICAAPGCISRSQHGHHVWPRSHLRGQPQEWVMLDVPGDPIVGNVVGVCYRHHEELTGEIGKGHSARIQWENGRFVWQKPLDTHVSSQPLTWQPPGVEPQLSPIASDTPLTTMLHEEEHADHGMLIEGKTCPTCGYTKPRKRPPQAKRKSGEWGVVVPEDGEIGTDVLDGWIEDFASVLGLEPSSKRLLRYHVLATVLAWTSQNMPEFIRDVREAGEA